MKTHRPVGFTANELPNLGVVGRLHLLRRSMRHHAPLRRQQVCVVADGKTLLNVMRHHQRRRTSGVVQGADQVGRHPHRDRVQAGERLVVHDDFRVQRDGPRQRHAPRHAAGNFGNAQCGRAAQTHRVELHQHDVADHLVAQIGVLAQRERHVLEHGQVGEQGPELKQHAEPAAQFEELFGVARVHDLTAEAHRARRGRVDTADQAQQGGLAATRAAQDGGDLAAREAQRHVVQDGPARVVAERDVVDLDEGVGLQVGGFARHRGWVVHVAIESHRMRIGRRKA